MPDPIIKEFEIEETPIIEEFSIEEFPVEESSPTSKGKFVTKGRYTEWEADETVDINKRKDSRLFGGYEGLTERFKNWADTLYSPTPQMQVGKKILGALPQLAGDILSDPTLPAMGIMSSPLRIVEAAGATKFPAITRAIEETKPLNLIKAPSTPKAQLQLPKGKDPYLGGPIGASGQVQRESLVTPIEESRLSGTLFEIDPTTGNAVPSGAINTLEKKYEQAIEYIKGQKKSTTAIESNEIILPSAPIKASRLKTPVQEAKENTGLDFDAMTAKPAPVAEAISQVIKEEAKSPSVWKAAKTELRKQSEELYTRSSRFPHIIRQYQAQWIPNFESAISKLSKTEKQNFGSYVEGLSPIPSDAAMNAVNIWKKTEDELGDEAARIGMRLYKKDKSWVPFQKREDYWPHVPVDKVEDTELVEKLVKSGMTRFEANKVVNHYKREGLFIPPPQHARLAKSNIPYRADADVAMEHIRGMSRSLAKQIEFGPLDIAGKGNEGIADLIENTPDKAKTMQIMQRIVGRDNVENNPKMVVGLDVLRRYASVTKLWNFTAANITTGQGPNILKAMTRVRVTKPETWDTPFVVGKEMAGLFKSKYRDEIARSGAIQNFSHSLVEEAGNWDPWMIGKGEVVNRTIAGTIGRATAKMFFNDLKKNPSNLNARKELGELILENIDDVIKQRSLTDEQLLMAAGRNAELTQALNIPGNLPLWASDPVKSPGSFAQQLFWIFKKTAFQQTKAFKDAIMANPAVNIPTALAAYQAIGEITGDVKQGTLGLIEGDPSSRIENRGDWISDDPVLGRILDNYMQSFMLGMPADIIRSASFSPYGLGGEMIGVVGGDISKLAYRLTNADFIGMLKDINTGLKAYIESEE